MLGELQTLAAQYADARFWLVAGAVVSLVIIGAAVYVRSRRRRQFTRSAMGDPQSLREHFRELRYRILICIVALLIGACIAFYFYQDIIGFLVDPARNVVGDDEWTPIYTEVTELLGTTIKICMLAGFVLALPVIFYQGIRFVSPGLTPRERKVLFSFLPAAVLAFVGGMAFGYFVMIPPALRFLLTFGGDVAEPLIRISNLVNLMVRLLFWLGISFETPLVMYVLAALGVVSASAFARFRRLWLVVAFVLAAAITPTIDPINQAIVAGPLIILYELGVLLARFAGRRKSSSAALSANATGD